MIFFQTLLRRLKTPLPSPLVLLKGFLAFTGRIGLNSKKLWWALLALFVLQGFWFLPAWLLQPILNDKMPKGWHISAAYGNPFWGRAVALHTPSNTDPEDQTNLLPASKSKQDILPALIRWHYCPIQGSSLSAICVNATLGDTTEGTPSYINFSFSLWEALWGHRLVSSHVELNIQAKQIHWMQVINPMFAQASMLSDGVISLNLSRLELASHKLPIIEGKGRIDRLTSFDFPMNIGADLTFFNTEATDTSPSIPTLKLKVDPNPHWGYNFTLSLPQTDLLKLNSLYRASSGFLSHYPLLLTLQLFQGESTFPI